MGQSPTNWQAPIGPQQSIYQESVTPKAKLGTRLEVGSRVFYYARADSTGIGAGLLCSLSIPLAHYWDLAVDTIVAGATSVTGVTPGATAVAVNAYADGTLTVNDDTGEGYTYGIKTHPVTTASVAFDVELYDPIALTFGAGATVSLIQNPYKDVIVMDKDSQAGVAIGVTPRAVTASYYFWLQTYGVVGVLADETTTAYTPLVPGAGVDGAVEDFDADGTLEQVIGVNLQTGVDTEYDPIIITIRN